MEVFVSAPNFRFSNLMFPDGSVVRDVLNRVVQQQGLFSSGDFYIIRNGQRSGLDNPLQHGAVYHLEPRLCGGKGGFGSMLRALGAQIEKTTNREACRDLSGRRLRDVNHEKEMAEWLKKQAEREAEKEQRRLERLQRKLSEPKHQFTDLEYQQQCHNLSERLEDSVIKGLQASSGSQVRVNDASATKRPSSDQSEQLHKKKKKKKAAACFWTGVDELLSSEDEDEDENEDNDESPSTSSSCGAAAVTRMTQTEEVEPDQSSSSSPASECSSSLAPQTATPEEAGLRAVDEGQSREEMGLRSANEGQSHGEESLRSADEGQSHEEEGLRAPDEGQGPAEGQRPVEASRDHPVIPTEDPEAFKTSESSCSSQQQQEDRSLLDLSSLSSVDQLESLGLDVLKQELVSRGLKCGGTLTERATRLFSIRGLTPDQIDPALLVKPGKTMRK